MKNWFAVLILIFFGMFLSGCQSPQEALMEAAEKTENIETGKSSVSLQINLEGSPVKEDIEPLFLEKLEISHEYDKRKEVSKSTVYANLNNFGVDFTIYEAGSKVMVSSPLLPKILLLENDMLPEFSQNNAEIGIYFDEQLAAKIAKIWVPLITDENVSKLGNVVVTTPDGDVKGKEFEITLSADQLKPALIKTVKLYADAQIANHTIEDGEAYFEEIVELIEKNDIGPISYFAYIDRDGIIVSEKLTADLKFAPDVSIAIDFQLQRFDLWQDVTIDLPELTDDNFMTKDDFLNGEKFKLFPN